jgi:hypothetical protein
MNRLRYLIPAAVAALALSTASAMAMNQTGLGGDANAHGKAVASAARNCPLPHESAASGTHGACVSAVASVNGQAHRNGAGAAHVQECRNAGLTGRDFGACVSGHAKNPPHNPRT